MKTSHFLPIIATSLIFTGCRTNRQAHSIADINASFTAESQVSLSALSYDSLLSELEFEAREIEITKDTSGMSVIKIPSLVGHVKKKHTSREIIETTKHDTIYLAQSSKIDSYQKLHQETSSISFGWVMRIILLLFIIFAVAYYVKKGTSRQAA